MGHANPPFGDPPGRMEEAVTPVVGTLLVLAITIVGMAGIMAWGAPTIEAIQAQNAQSAIVGEFEEVRSSTIALSIPDASRIPTINVPRGTLSIEQGTRFLVTSNQDAGAGYTGCDFRVKDWSIAPTNAVAIGAVGCRTPTTTCTGLAATASCLEILQVSGSNTASKVVSYGSPPTATVAGADFTQGNWLFRLTNGNSLSLQVYAQAWLLDSDALAWRLPTGQGGVGAFFDSGAVFSQDSTSFFLEKSPSLQENEFGSSVFSIRLRTLSDAGGATAVSGRGSYQVFLGLVGNYVRIDTPNAYTLRLDFQGELAESWCGSLVLRNNDLTGAAYTADPALPCAGPVTAVRSVAYQKTGGTAFPLELIHATIRTSIAQ